MTRKELIEALLKVGNDESEVELEFGDSIDSIDSIEFIVESNTITLDSI